MRTLVVRLGALGDALLTLPAICHLLSQRDDVTLLGTPESWAFLPPSSPISIEDAGAARWRALFSGEPVETEGRFDRAIVMLESSAVVDALSRAGVPAARIRPVRPGELGEHAAHRLLAGVGGRAIDVEAMRRLLAPDGGGEAHDIVLHPGSGGRIKRWPADRFAALARRARRPLVLLGPAEEEMERDFDGLPLARGWPLRRVAATLAAARVYVGNDSGVTHLASHLCPTLAIFGPTDPTVWSPVGRFAEVLKAPGGDLRRLSVDDVWRRLPSTDVAP